jgi:hypothetical protein
MQEDVRAAVYRGDHVYAAVAAVAGTDSRALAGSPPPENGRSSRPNQQPLRWIARSGPGAAVTLSFRAPIEPAIRGVMKPLRSGVLGVSDRSFLLRSCAFRKCRFLAPRGFPTVVIPLFGVTGSHFNRASLSVGRVGIYNRARLRAGEPVARVRRRLSVAPTC